MFLNARPPHPCPQRTRPIVLFTPVPLQFLFSTRKQPELLSPPFAVIPAPPTLPEDMMASGIVPSLWEGESLSGTPTAWISRLTVNNVDSALPVLHFTKVSPSSRYYFSRQQRLDVCHLRRGRKRKVDPHCQLHPIVRISRMGKISPYADLPRFSQVGSVAVGMRVPARLQGGFWRGSLPPSKVPGN